MPALEHKCSHCSYINNFDVGYVDPNLYTKPDEATVTRAHWCRKCDALIGCKYKFPNKDTVEFIEDIELKPSPYVSYGKPTHVDTEEKEQEEDSTDEQLDELFAEIVK